MSLRPGFPSVPPSFDRPTPLGSEERRHASERVEALDPGDDAAPSSKVRTHVLLFLLTLYSVFLAGANMATADQERSLLQDLFDPAFLARGASFALPLLAILVTHEFGHFFAAKWHRVPASLPYFIPAPLMPGTLGAVIAMRDRIRSRNALLDVGASGPLAGLVIAIPALAWGLAQSEVTINPASGYLQEGQSVLYALIKRAVVGPIPAGSDVWLHPTALAGWYGLLLTMLNLLPWGQLDGGHIAYALFGERHHAIARWFRNGLLALFGYNLAAALGPILLGTSDRPVSLAIASSTFWLVWFVVLGVLARVSGGAEHPPCEPSELSFARRAVGWLCLALFVLLFMPTPMAMY